MYACLLVCLFPGKPRRIAILQKARICLCASTRTDMCSSLPLSRCTQLQPVTFGFACLTGRTHATRAVTLPQISLRQTNAWYSYILVNPLLPYSQRYNTTYYLSTSSTTTSFIKSHFLDDSTIGTCFPKSNWQKDRTIRSFPIMFSETPSQIEGFKTLVYTWSRSEK